MRDFSQDHRWLSINTATVRQQHGRDWPLLDILDACARLEIRAVSPWRDQVHAAGLKETARTIKAHGLELSGYCRGGMFTTADDAGFRAALDDNRRAVDEACELGAPCLVLVVGGLPGALQGRAAHKDIGAARQQVTDGIAALLPYAVERRMPLAIEPLHPMFAADRACINTMEQALDVCDLLDPQRSGALGVAVDVFHTWWDPKLEAQIARAGRERLLAFHVCDWRIETRDLLNDRGMMGDGVIDLRRIRGWVEAQGFDGHSEVEIFSTRDWWQRDGETTLRTCIERHRACV
ncbi:sugar phosphate isomerase/epimerase family protein [Aquabacterium sp. J223]|uniref:sugar phosphate isomerase/epimerase family protein n=1 Tax=Aquabacterium sp. J223 TaxID=2898431 RepID=UPI0021ADD4C2|nr:sugar phosphate isomerase/epimerase family protein [Aquabacterium sp. J223]UUX94352.1 sugar phosphate isomerase/epimerase [Aquabacterium sp. J223]